MNPAPSLREAGLVRTASPTSPRQRASPTSPRQRARLATTAAVVALVLHIWALYRDHGPPTLRWFRQVDKVEHLVGFGLPCFLVLLALQLRAIAAGRAPRTRAVVVTVALFVLHAVVSEVVQGEFIPTRSGDPYDALADVVGTGLGLLGHVAARRWLTPATGEGSATGWGPRGRV